MMPKLIAGAVTRQSGMWRLVAVFALVLATLLPSLALAAKPEPFSASGSIWYITPGDVAPAGDSGRWVVAERQILGSFAGDLNGNFVLTYKANVEMATQAGNLHGTVQLPGSDEVLNVTGTIQPVVYVVSAQGLEATTNMSGHWNFTDGAQGQGTFTASATVVIDLTNGHVTGLSGEFDLTGQWQP